MMLSFLFATNGFLTPLPAGGNSGGTFWPAVQSLAVLFLFVFLRSRNKGISIGAYFSNKFSRFNNWVNSPEIVKTSVQVFNKSRESTSPEASYATSKIYGDFVALSDSDGNLLAEVPVKKIGEWFWILLTVGVIWKLSGN